MKLIKGFGLVIVVLAIVYLSLGLFGAKNYKVIRTVQINAPSEIVFKMVSRFNNWNLWSPWKEKDSTVNYRIEGEDGIVGAKYVWNGNPDISGKGSMTVNEFIENKKFGYDLAFTEPWPMESKGYFEIIPNGEVTTLNWVDEGDIPFTQRPFMLFMDLEAMIGPDFERGLFKIDSLSKIEVTELEQKRNITQTEFVGGKYLGVMHNIKISEIDSSLYGNSFAAIGEYVAQNEIEMAGAPSTITLKWDEENDSCQMIIAFPILEAIILEDNKFTYLDIPPSKSILYKYYGEYEEMGNAYGEIDQYLAQKGIEAGEYAIEQYITDPSTVESVDEVLTNIYYLIK